jgi:hypothetical protein
MSDVVDKQFHYLDTGYFMVTVSEGRVSRW